MSDNSSSFQESDVSSIEPSKTSEIQLESNVIESIRFYDKQEQSSFNINESNEIVLKIQDDNFSVESESVCEDEFPPTPCCTPNTDSEEEEYFEVDLSTSAAMAHQESTVKRLDFNDEYIELDKDAVVSTSFTNSIEAKSSKSVDENEWESVECLQYAEIPDFANAFVSDIIQTSIEIIKLQKNIPSHTDENVLPPKPQTPKIKWPRIGEFTKELGERAIMKYMDTWEYREKWLYCVDFLIAESDDYSDYFIYEAKWSIPTYAYPVPQATASIFFTIEVSKFKPPFCPVDVSYVFEGTRLVRKPGKIPFNEDYLSDIVDSKLCLYKRIDFYLTCF